MKKFHHHCYLTSTLRRTSVHDSLCSKECPTLQVGIIQMSQASSALEDHTLIKGPGGTAFSFIDISARISSSLIPPAFSRARCSFLPSRHPCQRAVPDSSGKMMIIRDIQDKLQKPSRPLLISSHHIIRERLIVTACAV